MPKLELTYFDVAGRAEPIRIALALAGLSFVDHRLSYAQFGAEKQKGSFPLGSVPVLTVDGFPMAQTAAMLRYVARLGDAKLYPTDPFAAFVVDSALDTFNDTLSHALMPSLFERDMAKKLEQRAAFAAGPLPLACGYVEALASRFDGPFLTGAALSIADLVVAAQVLQIQSGGLDGISAEVLAPYPRLRGIAEAYLAEPRIAAYRASKA
jgi:glutathione S-transferase